MLFHIAVFFLRIVLDNIFQYNASTEMQTIDYQKLESLLDDYCSLSEKSLIRDAFEVAAEAHKDQKRKSGEPYVEHPMRTACSLAIMKLNPPTIAASLLHDVVEDTTVSLQEIEKQFGKEISYLVDGVSKLSKVRIRKDFSIETNPEIEPNVFYSFPRQIENLRKMFIAMAEDIRVVLIKLADRLDNMRTLDAVEKTKQLRIAKETLEIYAPIAHRLGIGEIKGQLEDIAFQYVYPEEYRHLKEMVGQELLSKKSYLEKVKKYMQKEIQRTGVSCQIHGRSKHIYSLHNKMKRYDGRLDQIYDIVALRVIVKSVEDCYAVLGIIHKLWKPLPGRIKDYISLPKPNGYQSLHTTVFCIDGQITEFQIRTEKMHDQAEYGIAAHWHYKDEHTNSKSTNLPTAKELNWVRQLADWQKKFVNPEELADQLKLDFFQDRIFVFTPKGDVHDLPVGATAVDFAFAVHTDIGTKCIGAKANGKIIPLSQPLHSRDIVEILTSKKSLPKSDWLKFVKTSHAKDVIRQRTKSKDK